MRIQNLEGGGKKVWLSERDTEEWSTMPKAWWPCSGLRGRRVFAEFEPNGDLIDMAIDGGRGDQDCSSDEFNAIMGDLAGIKA